MVKLISVFIFGSVSAVLFVTTAHAKVFRNAYVSFELPDKWACNLEQTEWVCRTSNPGVDRREAIIVLTAKETGPSDNLGSYETHLKQPRTILARNGQSLQSQVIKVENRRIDNFPWVDGFHLASEIPNYYTRYLATTKDKIAVLVTFSAYKTAFTKYSSDFFRAIESLRIIASRSMMAPGGAGAGGAGGTLGGPLGGGIGFGADQALPDEAETGRGKSSDTTTVLGLAILVGAVGIYFFMKRKQNDD